MTQTKYSHLTNDELLRLFRSGDASSCELDFVMELVKRLDRHNEPEIDDGRGYRGDDYNGYGVNQ